MKILRIFFIAFVAWTLLLAGAMAEEDSKGPDTLPAIQKELMDQLNQQTGGKVRIRMNPKTGNVNYIGVDPSNAIRQPGLLSDKAAPEDAARGFLSVYGALFGLKDQALELKVMRSKEADRGRSFVRFQQVHFGVPIFGGELIVQTDSSNNIISTHGKVLPDIFINTSPAVSPEMAAKTALEVFTKSYQGKFSFDISSLEVSKPELWIYNSVIIGKSEDITHLVWRIEISPKEPLPIRELVLVDAHLGNAVLHFNKIHSSLYRKIYDHANTPGKPLPGNPSDLKRSEGQGPSGIADVDNAYDYSGDTYTFYWNYHGRDSINNAGMQLISTTRYCPDGSSCPYANAFWDGSQMVYGQGLASADDVVAHEMTHGVTDYESNLIYYMQSGAINEAFSDIWGEFVDLTNGRGNDAPGVRWLVGEDLPTPPGILRNMSNPPAYGDPDRMTHTYYYCGECDNGGVHWNSGVGNKAAYLMTDGGTFNGYTITALGITKVAKIFYEAQTNLLISSSDYEDLGNALLQACTNLVGTSGITLSDCQQVANTLYATEMNTQWVWNIVQNPGFESGNVSWRQYSSGGFPLIVYGYAACGYWGAWLGGYEDAIEYIYQDIAIPSNATAASFNFAYLINTSEPGSLVWDTMEVQVRRASDNAVLATPVTLSNLDDTGYNYYRSATYNLLPYKGQTIRLLFYSENDYSYPTSFFLDDVVLKVVVSAPPGRAVLISPSGIITKTTPTYTWNAFPTATWYHLWVNDSTGNKINQWFTRGEAGCASGTGTCSVTPTTEVIGSSQWWLQTYNATGFGPWSGPLSFTAPSTPPPAASLVSPSGVISDTTPPYTWNALSSATWYQLWVNDSTGHKINQWYTAAQAGCGSGIGTCSVTPSMEVRGSGQWWLQAYNGAGFGPWSGPLSFTAPTPPAPGTATLGSPSGVITDTTPAYTWNPVSNATWYQLWVNDSTGHRINQWYPAADAGCADGVGTCSVTPTLEVRGSGQWWLQTYNGAGFGPWSGPRSFTAPTPAAPSAATLVSPSGMISDITPTYIWNPAPNATWYQVYVNDSTGNKVNWWYPAADVGCADGVGTCSLTPTIWVIGSSQWWVRTYNGGGYGPWSSPMSFTMNP